MCKTIMIIWPDRFLDLVAVSYGFVCFWELNEILKAIVFYNCVSAHRD